MSNCSGLNYQLNQLFSQGAEVHLELFPNLIKRINSRPNCTVTFVDSYLANSDEQWCSTPRRIPILDAVEMSPSVEPLLGALRSVRTLLSFLNPFLLKGYHLGPLDLNLLNLQENTTLSREHKSNYFMFFLSLHKSSTELFRIAPPNLDSFFDFMMELFC